jgi:hypothetical protein
VTDGDVEAVQVIVSWPISVLAAALVIVLDERRLKGEALERCWPPASRDAAIFGLHPFCVLVHFARTRRSVWGSLLGLAWLGLVLAIILGAQLAVAAVIAWMGP